MSNQNKYQVYGGKGCKWCRKAEFLLEDNELEYGYHDVEKEFGSKKSFFDQFADRTNNKRTIPVVFVNGKFIGGYTQLEEFVVSNETLIADDF